MKKDEQRFGKVLDTFFNSVYMQREKRDRKGQKEYLDK
jgi:hypothetical protein